MKAKLVVVGGPTKTTEIDLKLPAIIGRGRNALITIPHSLVSRKHCELREENDKLVVEDLGSLNGTYVGDEKIETAVLEPGALLTVGTVTFRAVYEVAAAKDDDTDSAREDNLEIKKPTEVVAHDDETTRLDGDSSLAMSKPPGTQTVAADAEPVDDDDPTTPAESDPIRAFLDKQR